MGEVTDIPSQYDLNRENEMLQRKLEEKESLLFQRIRKQMEEIRKYSVEFYDELLVNSSIREALINPNALAPSASERMEKLMDIDDKLKNSKAELKKNGPVRKSARQSMMPPRNFDQYR